MKNPVRSFLVAAAAAVSLSTATFASDDSGYVDFGKFTASPNHEFVEINLQSGILKFASKIAAVHEPQAAELLKNIKHVRVNVVGMDDSNRKSTVDRVQTIRRELESQGWEKVVTAREGGDKGDDVMIFIKSKSEDAIDGIVVTVIEHSGNAVFVNVVGNIRAEQIANLGEHLDIKPLRKLRHHRSEKSETEAKDA